MTTDPKTLIEKYPLTAEACKINSDTSRPRFAIAVKDYANINNVGDFAFDSVESLMQAIESRLAAKRPKPLTEENVAGMRYFVPTYGNSGDHLSQWVGRGAAPKGGNAYNRLNAQQIADDVNAIIDRLWAAVQAERAEVQRLTAELEAGR